MKQFSAIAQTFILTGFSLSALSLFAVAPAQAAYFSGLGWLSNASSSYASGISADASVVIGNSGGQAVRWTQKGGMVGLGFLPDNVFSSASSISADGSVIAGTSGNNYQEFNDQAYNGQAFRWTQETGMVGLGFLPDNVFSLAKNISADGAVVVGESSNNPPYSWDGNQAFRWTQATGMVGLGFLSSDVKSPSSTVSGVSADGSVVVGNSSNGVTIEAFRWTQETGMMDLGSLDPNVASSTAKDVSADGSIVVGYSRNANGNQEAFRWTQETGMVSLKETLIGKGLDVSGWILDEATGISADGFTIVGNGINPSGQREGWVANLSPEPVPEPLTILGSIAAIGFAASFERKFNKNKSDEKYPED